MHFFTVLFEDVSESKCIKWVVYVYDSLETTAPVKKLELYNLFLKFNIPQEKVQVKIVKIVKRRGMGLHVGFILISICSSVCVVTQKIK
jgi:hypothetical protein